MDPYAKISQKIDQIEKEMKRIDYWSADPLAVDPKECTQAFCADKLTFQEWLQFIFIPNVRKIVEEKGVLPTSSMVGIKAAKEYNYMSISTEALPLVDILNEFDALITDSKEPEQHR